MNFIFPEPPPTQPEFDEDALRGFDVKRHRLRTSWADVVHPPAVPGNDLRLRLPFEQTYLNSFQCMVGWPIRHFVRDQGIMMIYLQGTGGDVEAPEAVRAWIDLVGQVVVMRDFMALSFALDYENEDGDPGKRQTAIGALRARAKPYGNQGPTNDTLIAAGQLADHCLAFLDKMTCYESADCVVATPPSDPGKNYNLPRHVAARVAEKWGRKDLTGHVRTIKPRNSIKGVALAHKLDTLLGTIDVDAGVFDGKRVLLIDDLYQSGTSMNYSALLLLRAGAKKIFGLACEKTCSNDDNVPVRR